MQKCGGFSREKLCRSRDLCDGRGSSRAFDVYNVASRALELERLSFSRLSLGLKDVIIYTLSVISSANISFLTVNYSIL